MNAPFVVAQANTQAVQAQPIRTIKLEKPANEQAVVIKMDGTIKLDFTAVEKEKITLVRAGERLVILFDNKSTLTIDPFFDSSGKPLQLGGIELSNNQLMTGEEFAALFPITDDQSVLPAAGEQGARNTGGQFAGPNVDDINGFNPLDLLPPEELGNFVVELDTAPLLDETLDTASVDGSPTADDSAPSAGEGSDIIDDEGQFPFGIFGALGANGDAPGADTVVLGNLSFSYGPDGPGDIVFDPTVPAVVATDENGVIRSLQARIQNSNGDWETLDVDVTVSADGHTVTGETVADSLGATHPAFRLEITDLTTGAFEFFAFVAFVHPLTSDGPGATEYEDDLVLAFDFIVTDGNGTPATATLRITVDDDSPDAATNQRSSAPLAELDESDGTGSGSDGQSSASISAATIAGLFVTPAFGADGPGAATYSLSAIDDAQTGLWLIGKSDLLDEIRLDVISDTLIQAREGGAGGTLAFTISINSATGEVTVTQNATLEHTDDGDGSLGEHDDTEQLAADIFVVQRVTDGDGDYDDATSADALAITFDDDGPTVLISGSATVQEGATLNGAWDLGPGADGVTAVSVTVGLDTKTLNVGGALETVTFSVAGGILTVSSNETWSFAGGDVSADTPVTFSIKATDGDGDFADDDHTFTVTDVAGGRSVVTLLGTAPFYEDGDSTTEGQRTNDGNDDVLTLGFSLQVIPTDANDDVEAATVGGIPASATATVTLSNLTVLTLTNGTITRGGSADGDQFLDDLESGVTVLITLAEHDSADVTLTLSAVIDGTATAQDSATAVVDTVAADPTLSDPADQSVDEGGASTTFTLTINADFADLGDNEFAQVLFGDLPADWSITSVSGNGATLAGGTGSTALPAGLTDAYGVGYSAYSVTPDPLTGNVTLTVTVTAPGSVSADTTETLDIVSRAYDVPTESGTEVTLNNNVAVAEQSVALTVANVASPVVWKIGQSATSTTQPNSVLEGGVVAYSVLFESGTLPSNQTVSVKLTFAHDDTDASDFDPSLSDIPDDAAFWQAVFDDLDNGSNTSGDLVTVAIMDGATQIGTAVFDKSTGVLTVTAAASESIPQNFTLVEFDLKAADDNDAVFTGASVKASDQGWGVPPTVPGGNDNTIETGEALFIEFQSAAGATLDIDQLNLTMRGWTKPGADEATSFILVGIDSSGNAVVITSATAAGANIITGVGTTTITFTANSNNGGNFDQLFSIQFASDVETIKIIGNNSPIRALKLYDFVGIDDGTTVFNAPSPTGTDAAPFYTLTDAATTNNAILSGQSVSFPSAEGPEDYTISLVDVDTGDTHPDSVSATAGAATTTILDSGGGGYADPLILDLGNSGISFVSGSEAVWFDMDADGQQEKIGWTNGEDGLLVMDLDSSGAIENGTEVLSPHFGGGSFANSLEALLSLDGNGDKVIDSKDAAFAELRAWIDADKNGVSSVDELFSLTDLGIESIDLNAQSVNSEIDGQKVFGQGQFTMESGEARDYLVVDLGVVDTGSAQMAMAQLENPPAAA